MGEFNSTRDSNRSLSIKVIILSRWFAEPDIIEQPLWGEFTGDRWIPLTKDQ